MTKEKLNKAYETIGRLACKGVRFYNLSTDGAEPVEINYGEDLLMLKISQGGDETVDELIVRVAAVAKAAVL